MTTSTTLLLVVIPEHQNKATGYSTWALQPKGCRRRNYALVGTDLRSGGPCERQNAKLRVRKLEKNASVGGKKSAWTEQCRISLSGVSTMVEPQIAGVGQIGWPPNLCSRTGAL
jgi:hypothetical protein